MYCFVILVFTTAQWTKNDIGNKACTFEFISFFTLVWNQKDKIAVQSKTLSRE